MSGIAIGWMYVTCALAVTAVQADEVGRFQLDNGLTVLLQPRRDGGKVAVSMFYRAGISHEPAGKAHLAHLVEHLVVQSGTRSYGPREAFQSLNREGMANAETLANAVRYDYVLPADQLDMALKIEAERLTSVEFTDQVLAEEVSRCLQEVGFVQNSPQGGLIKFGLMGLNQVVNHGATHVSVVKGARTLTVEDARTFHRNHYTPETAILAIVGDFDAGRARSLAEERFGGIPSGGGESTVTWKLRGDARVEWDLASDATYVVYPAADADADERLALTLFGNYLSGRLYGNATLKQAAKVSFCSNTLYPVGDTPFFAFAEAKSGQDIAAVRQALVTTVRESPTHFDSRLFDQLRIGARNFMEQSVFDQRSAMPSISPEMLLGQEAINLGIKETLRGGSAPEEFLGRLDSLDYEQVRNLIAERLAQASVVTFTSEAR